MNRIEKRLEELKQENKKAFITYTTAGLPDLQTTAKLIFAQEEAGADILEIGVPFSEPAPFDGSPEVPAPSGAHPASFYCS